MNPTNNANKLNDTAVHEGEVLPCASLVVDVIIEVEEVDVEAVAIVTITAVDAEDDVVGMLEVVDVDVARAGAISHKSPPL